MAPTSAASGVRTSWLTVARNSVLAALASSSSRSTRLASVTSSVIPCTPTTSPPTTTGIAGAPDVDDVTVGTHDARLDQLGLGRPWRRRSRPG